MIEQVPCPKPLPNGDSCTAHLVVSLYQLCAVISAGVGSRRALVISRLIARTTAVIVASQRLNMQRGQKRAMLAAPQWRLRVYRELGGAGVMARWELMMGRAQLRLKQAAQIGVKTRNTVGVKAGHNSDSGRAVQARRLAIFRRAKQRYDNIHGGAQGDERSHGSIFKDAVKTDFDGQFRLAPIPRVSRRGCSRQKRSRRDVSRRHVSSGRVQMGVQAGRGIMRRAAADLICVLPSELFPRAPRRSGNDAARAGHSVDDAAPKGQAGAAQWGYGYARGSPRG